MLLRSFVKEPLLLFAGGDWALQICEVQQGESEGGTFQNRWKRKVDMTRLKGSTPFRRISNCPSRVIQNNHPWQLTSLASRKHNSSTSSSRGHSVFACLKACFSNQFGHINSASVRGGA